MSTFLAFRIVAASVLCPQHLHRPATELLLKSSMYQLSKRGMKKERTFPTGAQIPYKLVQVQEADGTLHDPRELPDILNSVDRKTHIVRLVSHEPPIVRILSQLEDQTMKLERKAEKKLKERNRVETKEMQFTWLTSDADFEHKMSKARQELEKGNIRVDFHFTPKKGVRAPPLIEMEEQIQKMVDSFEDVSKEWKQREFFNGQAKMYLHSTVKVEKVMPTKDELEQVARNKLERRERGIRRGQKF